MTLMGDPSLAPRLPHRLGARTDLLWWLLAAALGFFAASLPQLLLGPMVDTTTRGLFLNGAFLIVGILMGALKPERAWRWGLASILALPLADAIKLGGDPNLASFSSDQIMSAFLNAMPAHISRFLPAGAGAYLGAFMAVRRL